MALPPTSETTLAFCSFLTLLVPFAIVGLALINTGLGRSHSAAHTLLASICAFAVAAGIYCICGFAWQGYAGGAAHNLMIGGKPWNWLAAQPFFLRRVPWDGSPASLVICLQVFSV